MKKFIAMFGVIILTMIAVSAISAQTHLNGQSLNGATGLFSIPTGRISWDDVKDITLDFGYRAVINNDIGIAHIPSITASFLKWVEISSAFDFQPDISIIGEDQKNDDLLFGIKIRLPSGAKSENKTSYALGANLQLINIDNDDGYNYFAYQPYIAITYSGTFFTMNTDTTVVFGKTFYSHGPDNSSDIDFGMGFDIILFPDVFKNGVHWIIDIANFGYSDNSWTNNLSHHTGSAWYRGIVNTGFRIDLSAFPIFSKMKFMVDMVFNDLFDSGSRSFTIGMVIGFPVK